MLGAHQSLDYLQNTKQPFLRKLALNGRGEEEVGREEVRADNGLSN
jgi:hypothetical protein